MIPYGHQSIDEDDITSVVETLRSDFLTTGPTVDAFEEAIAEYVQAEFAVSFSSGTAALHAAVAAGGASPSNLVTTSALTFVASANAGRYVGADVALCDIESDTLNLDPEAVTPDTDTLVAVHYAGLPLDLGRLTFRPRVIIEDAAHALGAATPDGPIGNCARSDMCCFSFHPVKTITTGEGGAVTTNDPELADRLRRFRNHNMVRSVGEPHWKYDIDGVGFNYRMDAISASLGLSQIRRIESFIGARRHIAARYRKLFDGSDDIELPPGPHNGFSHAHHLFPIRVDNRDRVFERLRSAGIGVQVHYIPIYEFSAYSTAGTAAEFPTTDRQFRRLISLPIFPGLTDEQVERVAATVIETVENSSAP